MGICGFKGNSGGVFHSIVETNLEENKMNGQPVHKKPDSSINEAESGKANIESTKQLPNGDQTVEEKKEKDSQSEMSKRLSRKIRKKVEKILADKSELGNPTEVFTKLERKKDVTIEMFILNSLKKHFLFSNLNDLQL